MERDRQRSQQTAAKAVATEPSHLKRRANPGRSMDGQRPFWTMLARSCGSLAAQRWSHWTPPGERRCSLISYEADILSRGLDVIFCGVNPAASAARAGHNFSNRSNRFWAVLHLAGFTDFRLQPQDERRLLEYGCGITAVVGRPTKRADEVLPEEFLKARLGFETKIRRYAPRLIAFLGMRALSTMIGQPDVEWGQHAMDLQVRWPGFFPIRAVSIGVFRLMLWWRRIPSFGQRCSAIRRSGCPG